MFRIWIILPLPHLLLRLFYYTNADNFNNNVTLQEEISFPDVKDLLFIFLTEDTFHICASSCSILHLIISLQDPCPFKNLFSSDFLPHLLSIHSKSLSDFLKLFILPLSWLSYVFDIKLSNSLFFLLQTFFSISSLIGSTVFHLHLIFLAMSRTGTRLFIGAAEILHWHLELLKLYELHTPSIII